MGANDKLFQVHSATRMAGMAMTAQLHGFDLQELPVLQGCLACPGELVAARSTVPLYRHMVGATVLVLCEDGDPTRPIIIGVLQPGTAHDLPCGISRVQIQADEERLTLSAEREIVLRCGDASITLTRAGKVLIRGHHIMSRSTGYNLIKGAAVDIN